VIRGTDRLDFVAVNSLASLLLWAVLCLPLGAQVKLGEKTTVVFATVEEGRKVLTSRDDFVQRLSPFDRAARMKTDREVGEEEYLKFVAQNVVEWNEAEKEKISAVFQGIQAALEAFALPFPEKVLVIKTTGQEEGGASYTRANAIVLSQPYLKQPAAMIRRVVSHELFHVLSRANPQLRERLYQVIGFEKCGEVEFPDELKSRKLTNPDAPRNDSCVRLEVGGQSVWGVPILFSNAEKYDVNRGGEFFHYLQFQFLLVTRDEKTGAAQPILENQKSKLAAVPAVSGFFEKVGRNSGEIFHPEEILADNFSLLITGQRKVPSPEILQKLEQALKAWKAKQ